MMDIVWIEFGLQKQRLLARCDGFERVCVTPLIRTDDIVRDVVFQELRFGALFHRPGVPFQMQSSQVHQTGRSYFQTAELELRNASSRMVPRTHDQVVTRASFGRSVAQMLAVMS